MTKRTILAEIRSVRHTISKEIGHDPRRITEYYAEIQAGLKDRLINRSGESKPDQAIQCNEPTSPGGMTVENQP